MVNSLLVNCLDSCETQLDRVLRLTVMKEILLKDIRDNRQVVESDMLGLININR